MLQLSPRAGELWLTFTVLIPPSELILGASPAQNQCNENSHIELTAYCYKGWNNLCDSTSRFHYSRAQGCQYIEWGSHYQWREITYFVGYVSQGNIAIGQHFGVKGSRMQLQDACQEDAASNSNEKVAVNSLKDDGNSYKWFSYQCFNGSNNSNKVKKQPGA